jgi:superfamily I DNA/RNA helicase
MADTAVFYVGFRAFARWQQTNASEDIVVQKHMQFAEKLIKRFGPPVTEGLEDYSEVIDKSFTPLKAKYQQAIRQGAPLVMAVKQARFLTDFISRLGSRPAIRRELFDGRGLRSITALSAAAEAESDLETLQKCAAIAPVSGVQLLRKWLERAAALAGVPVSDLDSLTNDVGAAAELGTKLGRVRNTIDGTDPVSPKAADLQAEKADIEAQISSMSGASVNPEAVVTTAATSASQTHQHATAIGKRLGHTPEQEQAMVAQGRTLIAAGAGSGKTRVLASKVAWHIEQGVPASSILATSFTRKSSAELVRRVGEYGGVINQDAAEGFGTTHSIAGGLLNRHARQFRRPNGYIGKKEKWKQVTVLRLAVEQVKMPGGGRPPAAMGFWDGDFVPAGATAGPGGAPRVDPDFIDAVDGSISYWQWILSQPWARYKRWTRPGAGYIDFLKDVRGKHPSELTASEKTLANKIFTKAKVYGKPISYRVASRVAAPPPDLGASDDLDAEMAHEEKKRSSKLSEYDYYKAPAGQWFNLGRGLSREDSSGKQKDVPLGNFARYISIVKGQGISPTQAWHNGVEGQSYPESDEAAVYAAYEWLKGSSGEPTFQSLGDMDDILIDTVRAMVASPELRAKIQARYKVLLVDEAQDLNQVQHIMFGLMAGYYDPETREPNPDKSMTADTFALIGDDKQAIYEFRGADPDAFIEKSDLKPGGDDFTTNVLEMNFRSGEAIVQAANKLIDFNTQQGRQIPMVCSANVRVKGQGTMVARKAGSTEAAALAVSEEIEALVAEGQVPPHDKKRGSGGYASFGVALRSNAEAYAYGLELLKKGIPFKSNARFFNDKNSKALIGWLTLAEGGSNAAMNQAMLDALVAPTSKISAKTVAGKLESKKGSWADYIQTPAGIRAVYGRFKRMTDRLRHFAGNVGKAQKFSGSPQEVLGQILTLRGVDGATFKESLIDSVKENGDVMAELEAEAEGGIVRPEAIEEMAMAPIQPLVALMGQKDDLGEAMGFVRKLQKVNEKISSKDDVDEIDRDAVTIGTMHSWKGLECPNMFIPMVGGRFPRTRTERDPVTGDIIDMGAPEEPDLWSARRLAYVAITRAEDRCVILDIPNPKTGASSQFISEACVPQEGTAPENDPSMVKLGVSGRVWDDAEIGGLLQSLDEVPDNVPDSPEAPGAPGLEEMWGEVL